MTQAATTAAGTLRMGMSRTHMVLAGAGEMAGGIVPASTLTIRGKAIGAAAAIIRSSTTVAAGAAASTATAAAASMAAAEAAVTAVVAAIAEILVPVPLSRRERGWGGG